MAFSSSFTTDFKLATHNFGLQISKEISYTTRNCRLMPGLAIATFQTTVTISTQKKRCSQSCLVFSDAEISKLVLSPLLVYISMTYNFRTYNLNTVTLCFHTLSVKNATALSKTSFFLQRVRPKSEHIV